ncbi:MAG: L-rhamnose isomerase [Abditibacteriota bacterium]|nr:L-rhamnose isomerase [Abditibacteriota bacterium]
MNTENINKAYELAKEQFASMGIDTEAVISSLEKIPISLHCWQTDDVAGFENAGDLGGGLQVTGNYPGKARNIDEVRADLEKSLSLIPGSHKVNLHAIYGDFSKGQPERCDIDTCHFDSWIDWAKENGVGLDYNGTFFSHPMADTNFTLSSKDKTIRDYWIEHAKKSRKITEYIGEKLGRTCVNNLWIPDGYKDIPADKYAHRAILKEALDEIFKDKYTSKYAIDAFESKLFGVGVESYTVTSNEFVLAYCMSQPDVIVTFDAGHFHPTEEIEDKLSSVLTFKDHILLHISRGVRWDSDHVVILNDQLKGIMEQVVRLGTDKIFIALDYFDGSINRCGAIVTGMRAGIKALMIAMLEPLSLMKKAEDDAQYFERLAIMEEAKFLPFDAVWNYYCMKQDVPCGFDWIKECSDYQTKVAKERDNIFNIIKNYIGL